MMQVFEASDYSRQLRLLGVWKFYNFLHPHCPPQQHASNASRVNEPLGMDTDMRWKWDLKTPCAHQRDGI